MLNHHSIIYLIISLPLTLLQCSFNTLLRVYIIHTLSVNLTLGILLCTEPFFKGSNNKNPLWFFVTWKNVLYGTFWVRSLSFVLSIPY